MDVTPSRAHPFARGTGAVLGQSLRFGSLSLSKKKLWLEVLDPSTDQREPGEKTPMRNNRRAQKWSIPACLYLEGELRFCGVTAEGTKTCIQPLLTVRSLWKTPRGARSMCGVDVATNSFHM